MLSSQSANDSMPKPFPASPKLGVLRKLCARQYFFPESDFIAPSTPSSQRPHSAPSIPFLFYLCVLCALCARSSFLRSGKSKIENPKSPKRQGKRERGAFPHFALHPDSSAVHFDKLLRQREAKSGALRLSGVPSHLLKFEETPFSVLRRDSRPCVAHLDLRLAILGGGPHPYLAGLRSELDRIADEI